MSATLLTARHVADQLGVTPRTVLRWTRQGDVPAVRLPSGQIRYRADELAAWLEARATPNRGFANHYGWRRPVTTLPSEVPTTLTTEVT